MSRKIPLAEGETSRTACARAVMRTGMDDTTGELLPTTVLAERVGWAADLVLGMVGVLLGEHWNATDVDVLASGEDAGGRKLPSNAWMACRRLGWIVGPPEGVKVNDRIVRMAQEQAGRTLRSVKWRADLTGGVIKTWPTDPVKRTPEEWGAVRDAVPGGEHLPSSVIKSRTRQVAAFQRKHGRLPVDLFEAEAEPRIARMLLLASCDGQQATIERADEPGRALLRLQLPTRPDPASYRDWTWVSCPISLPPTIPARAVLHLPTLRLHNGKVYADIAFTHTVPKASRTGHAVALGVDWGLNTLLSAGAIRRGSDGTITALGSGGMFRAAGVLARQHRLRRHDERLHAKADQYERLIGGAEDHALTVKHQVLRDEIAHVSARRSNLNDALAWSAARWTVDQAIAVVTVPARNTSKHCPQCLTPLRHRKAPDRSTVAGWKWAICPNLDCRYQGDRDAGAWRRIAARGLTHQTETVVDRASGTMVIRKVVDELETRAVVTLTTKTSRKDRSKTGPTRPRTTRPAPRRRRAPSPSHPQGRAGQRPEGHAHTDQRRLPRAAHRHQGVNTSVKHTHQPHRP
ncbi:transposase [Streptomyces sp. HC307]|uniref:transposase n=1 Tax=Streptomyces flavusporus TaxID=3385496 RepID=UPI003916FDDB